MKLNMKALLTVSLTAVIGVSGCSGSSSNGSQSDSGNGDGSPAGKKVELKVGLWDPPTAQYWQERVDKEFSIENPNVKVEFESFKSDGDYLQAMKVRMAANELPDVMMLKPNWLQDFKSKALPLGDMPYTKNNTFADSFKVDGNVVGVPYISFVEFVYYHPSIFKELDLQVPTTWPQFMDTLKKIQESKKYIPLSMGAKDAWTTYPFNEFMHQIGSGDENYLSTIAGQDQPFSEGTPFHKAYSKIAELYNAKVMGPDPLGTSSDQANKLFESKQAAVTALGLWYASSYVKNVGNTDDLAVFPLPYRDSESEPLKIMTFTDNFYMINKDSKNLEASKKLMDWLFSDKVYEGYMKDFHKGMMGSTMKSFNDYSPFLKAFYDSNKAEPFIYKPGNEKYTNLVNATHLDWKQIGQEMITGKKLSDISKEWNEKWSKARQTVK
jgi:raffinose/stachyose/melibiose transport system substrate-binding protein